MSSVCREAASVCSVVKTMEEVFTVQTSVSSQIRLNLLMARGKPAGPRQSGVEINHHARFTGLTENCYTTNQSQESTCLTMLHNECCVGYWKAGNINVHVR